MNYNGIKLTELKYEDWDHEEHTVAYWNDGQKAVMGIGTLVGATCHGDQWIVDKGRNTRLFVDHCAEYNSVSKETAGDPVDELKKLRDTIDSIRWKPSNFSDGAVYTIARSNQSTSHTYICHKDDSGNISFECIDDSFFRNCSLSFDYDPDVPLIYVNRFNSSRIAAALATLAEKQIQRNREDHA